MSEKVRNHPRLRLPLIAGLVLLLAVSCDTSHAASLDHAANLGHNAAVLFNSGTGLGLPNKKADTAARAVFLRPLHATRAPFSMVGRGEGQLRLGQCLLADSPTFAMYPSPLIGLRSDGVKPKKEATMPNITRALSHLFAAAYPVAHFPTESEAVLFARQYLAQTGRAVAVTPVALGFDVIGGAA